jgi:ribosomal protein L15E
MVKGLYQYLREKFKKPDIEELRKKMIDWRASGVFARVERPTNLARARSLDIKQKEE